MQTVFLSVVAAVIVNIPWRRRNARIRLLWLVGIPVVLFVVAGLVIRYFSHPPPALSAVRATPARDRASSNKFRQVPPSWVEPYGFTLNDAGYVEGWIYNKSNVPIDAVDFYVEIKNFHGDIVISETNTVTTQISPDRASRVRFSMSSSPVERGLFNRESHKEWFWTWKIEAAGTKAAGTIELSGTPAPPKASPVESTTAEAR
jgi:hypothetical protein